VLKANKIKGNLYSGIHQISQFSRKIQFQIKLILKETIKEAANK
jgi:hypothetical protein